LHPAKIKNNDLYLRTNCFKPLIPGMGSGVLNFKTKNIEQNLGSGNYLLMIEDSNGNIIRKNITVEK